MNNKKRKKTFFIRIFLNTKETFFPTMTYTTQHARVYSQGTVKANFRNAPIPTIFAQNMPRAIRNSTVKKSWIKFQLIAKKMQLFTIIIKIQLLAIFNS
jgi:hypothetical protein